MAKKTIKMRAKASGDVVTVKALLTHPMETGLRKNKKTGEKIPAHYITEVSCEHGGKQVLTAYWGPAISKNPYLSFKFKGGNKGDAITLTWKDNTGKSDSASGKIG